MSKFPFDIVLFDLDGTLVDSARDLCPAVNHALTRIGRDPVSEGTSRTLIGGGTDMMLTRALEATGGMIGDDEYCELSQTLLDFYWDNLAVHTVPYPGCEDALAQLREGGVSLALCTNKSEKPARELLDALAMTAHFDAIYGGDTLGRENAKPAPDMLHAAIADCGGGRALMVGDTTYDVRAARAASVPVLTFTGGYADVAHGDLGSDAHFAAWHGFVDAARAL
ncbi:HAD-IA family hydrolase [Aurantiacibacter sediminis]|uniref:phosphoglycolate phosphatase n=1 Tax=Aurantiacibacter sediminis TaxID=2793064 RepID=A0ABS0N5P7_9SPHN|nr:HAD-IA family hydrolase [Aurantiacibacter sediminis]MBH5323124.1 HAD-IA family hydrolase [Aurantiacibacter sediminis]